MLKRLFVLLLSLVCVSCASSWDIGKGSAEIRRVPEPKSEVKDGEKVQDVGS